MAPKKKTLSERGNTSEGLPHNENRQLSSPYLAYRPSTVTEPMLQSLVAMGVVPPKEVANWRVCEKKDDATPTEDTYEAMVFMPFFIQGLGLSICSFVRGLLQFYAINLTHLNPNSILQLSIFIHLCEAFLGIVPHFGLWKYLYHCKAGLRDRVLQVTGGASFEL